MASALQGEVILEEARAFENCRKGKWDDFGVLYDLYVKKIYDFIYFKTHHKETAEDLTSRTFMKALENIQFCDPEKGLFSSWLYRIARNTVIDHYRKKNLETVNIEDAWDISDGKDLLEDIENKTKFQEIKKYLERIKPEHREIVMLRVWSGLSYKEIAQIIGKSEDNCKVIFGRVVAKFRQEALLLFLLLFFAR